MAGNHPKKSTERRDTNFKQQRKNSAGGKNTAASNSPPVNTSSNNNTHNNNAQAAGAAILSAVTSPQSSGLNPQQQQQQQQQSMGANGLNRGELVEFLNMRFSDALTAYHDTNLDPKIRAEKYESKVVKLAWGKSTNGVPSAWGQQSTGDSTGTMVNGADFLTELSLRTK
ncbi:unnamed protein product [Mucor hiemalis]